jgi:hypothetical protein
MGNGKVTAMFAKKRVDTMLAKNWFFRFAQLAMALAFPEPAASQSNSPLSCGYNVEQHFIFCDVVTESVVISQVGLNRGSCEYFPLEKRYPKIDYDAFINMSFEQRAGIYEVWGSFFELLLLKHPEIEFGMSMASTEAPLMQNIFLMGALRDLKDPQMEKNFQSTMALPVYNGMMADYIGGRNSTFADGTFSAALFMSTFLPFAKEFNFGEQVLFPIQACENLLEYTINVNSKDWTWSNY